MRNILGVKWNVRSHQSGTVNVEPESNDLPFISVHYAFNIAELGISEFESNRKRIEMASSLCDYLNGGQTPKWLCDCYHGDGFSFKTPLGGSVSILGPMVLPPNDNGRLAWVQDYTDNGVAVRKRLFMTLENVIRNKI